MSATSGLGAAPSLVFGELSVGVYLILEPAMEALSGRSRRLSDVMAGVLSVGADAGSKRSFAG